MSAPTPRTDAEAVFPSCNDSSDTSHPQGTHVIADFARTLERELAAERQKVRVLQEAMKFLANKDMYFQVQFDPCQRASAALAATEDKP